MTAPAASIVHSSSSLFVPHEILGEILSHCDACTLAAVSRVSSACLELASPFLYTDVVVKDIKSIIKLFHLSPASDITLSEIDRVTRFTSLSLVHSITVHLGYRCIDFGPLRELELPPPLAIAVFVVSTPGPNSSTSSQHYDLSLLAQLVSPRVFIVRGRQPKPDSIHFRPAIISVVLGQYSATAPYWDLLEVALLIGASVHHWDLVDSRQSEVRLDSSLTLPPLRMIVDLVSAPEEQFAISGHAASFVRRDGVISDSARKGINLKAWVRSAGSKKTLEEEMKRWELQIPFIPLKGKHADVQVVCDRIRRFRDDLALGANKGMDWAVLDEM